MSIPAANVLDSFDRSKFTVVNIDIVSDSNKRLMDISNWKDFVSMLLNVCLVQLSNLFV